jgi:rhamnulokinase
MPAHNFLACDLGAESGRVMLGSIASSDGRLTLEELHRFANEPVQLPNGLYWDAFRLFHDILRGLTVAGRARKLAVAGIGIDAWGVDFGLTGRDGGLVDNPRHYRDSRNNGMMERTFAAVPRDLVFAHTGIQLMQINSLCQLYAAKLAGAPGLDAADKLLFMPDLFNYWLTGERAAELTIASTSQFYNPRERRWSTELFDRLGLPAGILPDIVEPGRRLGSLLPHVQDATGLRNVPVYATASHDTASAVAAVPARGTDWCYISSGTWSLMGVELEAPLINEHSLAENLTNEVGFGGRIRLLKNIAGLWLVQECRRAWAAAGQEYTYAELTDMAASAPAYEGWIDPDQFLEPGHMPDKIGAWCRRNSLPVPKNPGALIRAILESLAERYRQVLAALESLTGRRINTVHIVGGGSKNRLLNQLVADATGRIVVAGPSEATAAGNVLVQAIGSGLLADLEEARELVRRSFEVETFEPCRAGAGA